MDDASFHILRRRIVLHEWALAGAAPELGADRSSPDALTRAAHRTKPVSAASPTMMAPSVGVLAQCNGIHATELQEENQVLKAHLDGHRLRPTDTERRRLATLAHPLARERLKEIAAIAAPDTLLGWYSN